MKKYSLFLLCLMAAISLHAQSFADYFADKTLRVDYIFTGNAAKHILKKGTIVDSTIISAPSSTKNKEKKRDPSKSGGINTPA